ncbi:MAG: four helix bundle protein [Archangium sp.]|nr:four helix bundle protein [Archangium sp.]
MFDQEKLEVYRVAREFLQEAHRIDQRKLSRELRDQFERASLSILANIAEGAGKTARAEKQRFYEIARGSTTETATLLDVMQIRATISAEHYGRLRSFLIRVSQMLSRLCADPRSSN